MTAGALVGAALGWAGLRGARAGAGWRPLAGAGLLAAAALLGFVLLSGLDVLLARHWLGRRAGRGVRRRRHHRQGRVLAAAGRGGGAAAAPGRPGGPPAGAAGRARRRRRARRGADPGHGRGRRPRAAADRRLRLRGRDRRGRLGVRRARHAAGAGPAAALLRHRRAPTGSPAARCGWRWAPRSRVVAGLAAAGWLSPTSIAVAAAAVVAALVLVGLLRHARAVARPVAVR